MSFTPVSLAYYIANKSALDAAGNVVIVDTAADLSTFPYHTPPLDALAGDPQISAILVYDSAPVYVSLAQLSNSQSTLALLSNADGSPYKLSLRFYSSELVSNLATLGAYGPHLASITLLDGGLVTVTAAQFLAYRQVLDAVSGGFAVADTGSALSYATLDALSADPKISAIQILGTSQIQMTASQAVTAAAALSKLSFANGSPFRVDVYGSPTGGADVTNYLDALNGIVGNIGALFGCTAEIDVSQFTKYTGLASRNLYFDVSGAASSILSVVGPGWFVKMTVTDDKPVDFTPLLANSYNFFSGYDLIARKDGKPVTYTFSESGGAFLTSINNQTVPLKLADIASVTLTDSPLTVDVATFLADQAYLDKIVGGFTVADSAFNLDFSALDALSADAKVSAIKILGGTQIQIYASQAVSDAAALSKLTFADGSPFRADVYGAASGGADVTNYLDALNAIVGNIGALFGCTASIDISKFPQYSGLASRNLYFNVSGPASSILSVVSPNWFVKMTVTDDAPVDFTPLLASPYNFFSGLDPIARKDGKPVTYTFRETGAAYLASIGGQTLPLKLADIASVTVTDGPPTVNVATFLSEQAYLDKIVGGFNVSDSAAHLAGAVFDAFAADANVNSIGVADGQPVSVTVAQLQNDAAFAKLVTPSTNPYKIILADTADNIVANWTFVLNWWNANGAQHGAAVSAPLLVLSASQGANWPEIGIFARLGISVQMIAEDTAANVGAQLSGLTSNWIAHPGIVLPGLPAMYVIDSAPVPLTGFAAKLFLESYLVTAVFGNDPASSTPNFALSLSTSDFVSLLGSLNPAGTIASIALNGGPPLVSCAQFLDSQSVLDKIVGGFTVGDTGANLIAHLAALGADANVTSLAVSDAATLVVTAAQFTQYHALLDTVAGGYVVSDTAVAVWSALDALSADTHVVQVKISDDGLLKVSYSQLGGAFAAAESKFVNADGSPVRLEVDDLAVNLSGARFDALSARADLASIVVVVPQAGPVTLSAEQVRNDTAGLAALSAGTNGFYHLGVSDYAANVVDSLSALQSQAAHIDSISLTRGVVKVDAATFLSNEDALERIVVGYTVADVAANLGGALDALGAAGQLNAIVELDSAPLVLSAAQFAGAGHAFDKLTLATGAPYRFAVADTAANILAALPALSGQLTSLSWIQSKTWAAFSTATFASYSATLDKVGGGFVIWDSAANVLAALPAIAADAHIRALSIIGPALSATAAQFSSYRATLDKITGGFAVVDAAANVQAALTQLCGDSNHLRWITATGGPVTVTAALFSTNAAVIDKIGGGVAVSDTAANLVAALPALVADVAHLRSLVATDGALTVGVDLFSADAAALNKTFGGFAVADTASALLAALPALAADAAHIRAIVAADAPVTVDVATLVADKAALNKVTGGIIVRDTAANLIGALPLLTSEGAHIASIVATDAQPAVGAAVFKANAAALAKVAGGYSVSDTAANVKAVLGNLAWTGNAPHINQIVLTDAGTPVLTLYAATATADAAALGKIVGGWVLNILNPDGTINTYGHGPGLTINGLRGNDTISGGGSHETFVLPSGFGVTTITDFSLRLYETTPDVIVLPKADFAGFADLLNAATQVGSDLMFIGAKHDVLTLSNMTAQQLRQAPGAFQFV